MGAQRHRDLPVKTQRRTSADERRAERYHFDFARSIAICAGEAEDPRREVRSLQPGAPAYRRGSAESVLSKERLEIPPMPEGGASVNGSAGASGSIPGRWTGRP